MIKLMHKKTKGFTLIELLAVIAIIGILAAILLPALLRARAHARHGRWITGIRTSSMIDPDCALFFTFEEGTIDRDATTGNPEGVENLAHGFTSDRVHIASMLDGTIGGNPQTDVGRFPGKTALYFDGAGDYVSAPSSGFNISQGSYELWFRPNQLPFPTWDTLIHHETPSVNRNAINIAGISGRSTIAFHISNAAGTPMGGWSRLESRILTVGSWYHIVATWNATTGETKLYINSVLDDSLIGTEFPTATALNIGIGKNLVHAGREINGIICEVAIFNRALSADEIRVRFEGSRP